MALQSITALSKITLQEPSGSVEFSGIPNTYRDLTLVFNGSTTSGNAFRIFLNNDLNSNYPYVRAFGNGSSTGGDSATEAGARTSAGGLSALSSITTHFVDYSATNKHTTMLTRADTSSVTMLASRWSNLNAVNLILLDVDSTDTFTVGSTFSLFGRIA